MRTNIFNVKEKDEKKIIIEEERTKNPFLLFLKRHRKFILLSLLLTFISAILAGTGIAFSLFGQSTDFDISYLNDTTEEIKTNINPEIKEEDVKEKILGSIGREEGVIILVKTFMDKNNNVIYYFSDNTSIIVKSDGKIYRVSATSNGKYGIDENGKIDPTAKQLQVKSSTTTLSDGSVITNYSDGSAKIEHKNVTVFVRNSNKIKINNGTNLKNVVPSGVAINTEIKQIDNQVLKRFTDNTKLLIGSNNNKYIINPNAEAKIDNNKLTYDKYNSFGILEEKKLSDNNTITYFENGSAIITTKDNNTIYVKKSGDIIIKNNSIYEIVTNKYGYSKKTVNCSDGKKVTYFDNGAAIITYPDGTKKYVQDSNDILYDANKNIKNNPPTIKQKSIRKTTDGYKVINFDNGKSEVIKEDGTSFIIDTSKLIFDNEGRITKEEKKEENKDKDNKTTPTPTPTPTPEPEEEEEDPLEGMYVSEAEHKFNDDKNIEYTNFLIKNTKEKKKRFRIVIEEIPNYERYNAKRLEPSYVKYQASIGNEFISPSRLDEEIWQDEDGDTNYVIYEGSIGARATLEIVLTLYVDYAELDNSKQDSTFYGTVKTYVVS